LKYGLIDAHLLIKVLTIIVLHFQSDVIERLRLQYAKDLEKVVHIVFSHQVISVNCFFK
jgi:hypothetical protein